MGGPRCEVVAVDVDDAVAVADDNHDLHARVDRVEIYPDLHTVGQPVIMTPSHEGQTREDAVDFFVRLAKAAGHKRRRRI